VSNKQFALVLSGGAARCIAQLGVLQAMEEAGVKPAVISGVSGGAIVGAFYCTGISPHETLKIIKKTSLVKIFSPAWKTGVIKLDGAEKIFREHLGHLKFEDLNIPFFISACDVNSAEYLSFSSGEIVVPLLASCAVPPVIRPVEYLGRRLVDGGILNNLPVDPVKDYEKIAGVNVNIIDPSSEIDSFVRYTERTVDLIVNNNIKKSIEQCGFFLQPESMTRFHLTDVGRADEMFAVGYDEMKKRMGDFKSFLEQ
jgi:NTE family protein